MIHLEADGRRTMLMALRNAASQVALKVGDSEPANERYARASCGDWQVTDEQIVGSECAFMFSGPVGIVTGYEVLDVNGDCLFWETFDRPYDFTEYGGRLRVVPIITLNSLS